MTLGIFTANMINYGTQNIKQWGWNLSPGLTAALALFMNVGGLLLPETPNSLIERGGAEEGRRVLERIRGTADVDAEFKDMVEASVQAFLWLLCAFKFGIFLFLTGWITVVTVFIHVFLPETKSVPIEEMVLLWRKHWFWKKVMPDMLLEDGWGEGGDAPADNK